MRGLTQVKAAGEALTYERSMPINVYAIATPFVLVLALAEFVYCLARKNGYYSFQDSIASVGTAVLNQCVNVGVALLVLPLFGRVIPKLPRWIESWMNTPSHHRVHHARNDRYLDKNYAGFLIIWDKLFGTYADETEECSYGLTTPSNTWDPTVINFQAWSTLVGDAVATKSTWDRLRIWLMPTGWRPSDLPPRKSRGWRPEVKFQSTELPGIRGYLVFQMLASMPLMLLVSHHHSPLNGWQKVAFTAVLWAMATAWAGMLESKRWGLALEAARVVAIAFAILLWTPWGVGAARAAAVE